MLSSDGRVEDEFFDSSNYFSSDELSLVNEEQGSGKFDYEIWTKEPRSVKERRKRFLCNMGLSEFASKIENSVIESSQEIGLDRITECNGAVSSCLESCTNEVNEGSFCERKMISGANGMVDEWDQDMTDEQKLICSQESELSQDQSCLEERSNVDKKKAKKWWERLVSLRKRKENTSLSEERKLGYGKLRSNRMKVKQNQKKCAEVTALYAVQEIKAHKGYIETMKFSPDRQYLATGGVDGIVRIWHVSTVDGSFKYFSDESSSGSDVKETKSGSGTKKMRQVPVLMPDKVFQIDESPIQEFHGHVADVLDLAWSNSNCLLSCSMDKTVRMWQVGCDQCLNVFHHSNYVTCIQFNPADESYFISGSIDGKVRIWGVSEKRVVDWTDVRDVISAICYKPDGQGFLVGTMRGTCRFYDSSGNVLMLETELRIRNRKKSSSKKITGIQYCREKAQRVMITTEDSKVRILDGVHVIHKFKGLPKSGSQMSASFTTAGKHIISVGEDSHVYVWNYDTSTFPSSKHPKSVRSCEHFFSEGVSVAAQWSGMGIEPAVLSNGNSSRSNLRQRQDNLNNSFGVRDSQHFSLGSWFSMEGSCRGSATWPEEKLPPWDLALSEVESIYYEDHHHDRQQQREDCRSNVHNPPDIPEMWGLVIVTGSSDGTIKTFHNYGLPVRL